MSAQGELLPVEHRSMTTTRLRKHSDGQANPERIYQAQWLKFTRRERWSTNLLDLILFPDGGGRVTRRDAAIIATFVQWLGTNVGGGFVRGAEQAIHDARERAWQARARGSVVGDDAARHAERQALAARSRERMARDIEL